MAVFRVDWCEPVHMPGSVAGKRGMRRFDRLSAQSADLTFSKNTRDPPKLALRQSPTGA